MFGFFRRQDPRFKDDGNFLLAQVRTSRNKELIKVRISKSSEMSLGPGGYFVRKHLTGSKTLDKVLLEINATRQHKVKIATVDGGELLLVKYWET